MNYCKYVKDFKVGHYWVICIPILLFLLYYYLGIYRSIVLVAYIMLIGILHHASQKNGQLGDIDKKILIILGLQALIGLFVFSSYVNLALSFRLYFGFIVVFLCLQNIQLPKLGTIGVILALLTVYEYLVIKIDPEIILHLPNYDTTFDIARAKQIMGGVHSFGGSRTNTSVLLLAIYIFLDINYKNYYGKYLVLLASIIGMSGTAILLLFCYLLVRSWHNKFILISFILLLLMIDVKIEGNFLIEKFNSEYIIYIFFAKLDQIYLLLNNFSALQIIFGDGLNNGVNFSNELAGYGAYFGDFIFLDFIARFGLFGLISIGYFLSITVNKYSFIPITVLLIGSLHYHVIFSAPGQLLTALILIEALRKNDV